MDDFKTFSNEASDEVYSESVRAGKRTYFFDVKATKSNDYYLTITESKRRIDKDGRYIYDKHKIFLYKEDFEKFSLALEEVLQFIKEKSPYTPEENENQPRERFESSIEPKATETNSFSDVNFDEL